MKHAMISRVLGAVALGVLATVTGPTPLMAGDAQDQDAATSTTRLLMPRLDSARGMELFVEKGCATCHSVNGVGGEDAAALDAHDMDRYMNPFDLAARMWSMATIMIPAQQDELGAQIEFTGDELGDIIAFLHDDAQQHQFAGEYVQKLRERMMPSEPDGQGGAPANGAQGAAAAGRLDG